METELEKRVTINEEGTYLIAIKIPKEWNNELNLKRKREYFKVILKNGKIEIEKLFKPVDTND